MVNAPVTPIKTATIAKSSMLPAGMPLEDSEIELIVSVTVGSRFEEVIAGVTVEGGIIVEVNCFSAVWDCWYIAAGIEFGPEDAVVESLVAVVPSASGVVTQ